MDCCGLALGMAEPILSARRLTKAYGGVRAMNGLELDVAPHTIHAVVGPNGAGKTTMINLLSGQVKADAGSIQFAGYDITRASQARRASLGLARSYQITSIFREFSVLDNVALAIQCRSGHGFRFWRPARKDRTLREPAAEWLRTVGIEARAEDMAGNLSHGEQRQLEIAMTLATGPKLLLLDEPMAGMGRDGTAFMIDLLRSLAGRYTMVLVEHDMDAVFALADTVSVLVYGQTIATGTPAAIRENDAVRQAYLGEDEAA